jgi:hypothetical protein
MSSMTAIISGLIGGIVAVAVTTWIARRAGSAVVPGQLRFGPFIWVLAVACLAFALFPLLHTVFWNDGEDHWAKALLFVGFGLGAVYCFGEAAFVRGTFDEKGIVFSTPWTGLKREKWEDLQYLELNAWCNWYTLTFRSGSRIRLSCYLSGHMSALEAVHAEHRL